MGTLEWEEDVEAVGGGLSYGEVKEKAVIEMMPKSLVLLAELKCPSLRLGFRPKTEGTDEGNDQNGEGRGITLPPSSSSY